MPNEPGASAEFPNEPASVRAAREFVSKILKPYGIEEESARIAISELATNAVRHAQTPFTVSVLVDPGTVRLEVEDGAGAMSIATDLASDGTSRGLRIVEAMALDWGVEERDDKKAVWVRLQAVTDHVP